MAMIAEAADALDTLIKGNQRFASGSSIHRIYGEVERMEIAQIQQPFAAVVACADSRVAPEVVFDQPLGAIFCARVPGNVAADSALWMVDLAVSDFSVPLLLVVGHTNCLAVGQIVNGEETGVGGPLRSMISYSVFQARLKSPVDLMQAALEENVRQTVEELPKRCASLHRAVLDGKCIVQGALYEMESGIVRLIS
jgi:carbonic anhydrase